MNDLYHIEDGLLYQKKIKMGTLVTIIVGICLFALLTLMTWLNPNTWVMIIDILLTTTYLSYVYVFVFFATKQYMHAYQFLAKIQHFTHQTEQGVVIDIDYLPFTHLDKQLLGLKLESGRTVFIEKRFIDCVQIGTKYTFTLLENVVIAIRDISSHE